ncbi:ATP synthase (C/AC39) subunit [Atopostipes suicloacalis DSM 15692]|uniref:ATP synthase (C/AC39) subunit n=2 Tax=Atopostipes suicloacalis TaxID=180295 RepID=A0A1M4TVM7_9LACT|nr:ATP synthase (C/AC39) subunit [Atopostipes suicloacalis DSM 15692]
MMNDYTAILTKVRAMRSKLLSKEEIQNNHSLKSLEDIYQVLQRTEGYDRAARDTDITELTPRSIIPIIHNGVYYTFLKLYRFANLEQRKVLKLYGIKYETDFIKKVINNILAKKDSNIYFEGFTDYLEKSRHFDIDRIESATTIDEVIDALNGTIYAEFFEENRSSFQEIPIDSNVLNVKFDQFIAMHVWKRARHIFSEKELKQFKKYYGSFADLINIESIYRLKFIYEMSNEEIKNYILPPSRQLDEVTIEELLQANNQLSFERLLRSMGYAEVIVNDKRTNDLRIEESEFLEGLLKFLVRSCRESMLPILEYLEDKQREASLLAKTTEKIGWNNVKPAEKELV